MDKPLYTAYSPDAQACPRCGQNPCACVPSQKVPLKQKDPVTLRLDKSGRGGKAVTLIAGLQMHPDGKLELLQKLKKSCGTGGTLKRGVLEVRGDQRERLKPILESLGYKVKTL